MLRSNDTNSGESTKDGIRKKNFDQAEDDVEDMLARLSSAMNIRDEVTPDVSEILSVSRLGGDLVDSCLSLDRRSDVTNDEMTSSTAMQDSQLTLETICDDTVSHTSSRPPSRHLDTRPGSCSRRTSVEPERREEPRKKKKERRFGKKSKSDDKRQMELDMWNASDSTVLEHLLKNKGQVGKWQAVATARGLCSLSNNCRCPDCQSSYVMFDEDGDGGLGAGVPLYHIMAPACSVQ